MAAVTITLTDDDLTVARKRAFERGFADLESYLGELVSEHLREDDPGAPEHLQVKSREQLAAMIREGLASPARQMTQADFDQMRSELIERHRST